ncbi:MAG TPA: histidine kinase dimerization/phospho-acceptor domain-containing protein, partial [Flavisolibacter sp.]|nr:histidine kinase dimerization/phospho-acceptor domain-containing protein [Flavisolibacter sp.]
MPVRLRITLLFSLLVFFILGLVCTGIYYFSYQSRINTIKTRLTNRAITTARLLSQREIFNQELVRKIDSVTTISLKNKTVQAYDKYNNKIYIYSDVPADTISVDESTLAAARQHNSVFFLSGDKEAVAYYYNNNDIEMVVVSSGEDTDGHQSLASLLRILIISFLVGNLLVILAGYFFSRSLLFPISRISKEAAEISAQNLARRIHTGTSKDEWYQLSSTLNELLDRLQQSFEMQQRFIANASHELSTPLTSISSQLEVAMQRERDADEYLKVMRSIYQDVQHMSKLTQTLLEFAKASGTRSGIEIDLVRMDEVVLKLPSEMAKMNANYSVKLDFASLPEEEEHL